MRRRNHVMPLVTLIASLLLAPCAAPAAEPHQHHIRWVSSTPLADLPSAYLAENPGHGFDAWIAPDGVRARARDGAWQLGLGLVAVGWDGAMKEAAPAGVEAHGNRAELHRGSLTEWYVNDERGLEQGFTLEERPAGTAGSELVLELELTGDLMPLVAGDGRRLDLLRPGNPLPVVVYSGLTVVDAEGLELTARLRLGAGTENGGRGLRIVVADADAVYPVTVDPLLTTAVWSSSDTDNTRTVAWGDWDGDGDLDLATGNFDGAIRVYENDGLGQPGSLTSAWTSADTDGTSSVAWGDWDGDGDLDLAAGNNVANRVYGNDGLGLASSLTSVWTSAYADLTISVAWGDWDGDGDLDLATGNYSDPNRVYVNDGLGQPGSLTPAWASADTDYTLSVAWGDWDGDGDLDLAAGNRSGEPNRLYGNTGGALASVWTSADTDYTQSMAWGDWDGDGDLDLAAANFYEANRVYSNDGLGQPGSLVPVWVSADTADTRSVAWGDWDGDGDLDLAVGKGGSANRVYSNDGLGQPSSLISVWTSSDTDNTMSVAWGDWDGDGDLDLAAGNFYDHNRVYENDGLGQPSSLTVVWTSADADYTQSVAWGDWDGDGDLDLAAGNVYGHANRVYSNDGLGQPGSLASVWTSAVIDDTLSVAWGDWDGDGDLDLAAGNLQANRVYENTGGALASTWSSEDTNDTHGLAWGDWDGDGDLDLAAGNNGDANRVYENGWLRRPGGLPENPVSPALSDRPGATDAAFFFSAAECLESPVTVEYTLTDEESDPALRIVPEYSVVGRAGWQPATEGPGGSGTTNLPADADGRDHSFVWDSYADSVAWDHDVRFRITVPHQASLHAGGPILRGAMSAVSPPFRICDIPADVAVTKDDGVTQVVLGQFLTYTITVSHQAGLAAANAVRVIDDFPAGLTGVFWNCLEDGGGSCSDASGSGDIDTFVDLPVGTYVTLLAAGTVTAAGSYGVTNTVEVQASLVAPDPFLANNSATDTNAGWLLAAIFADGFESGGTSAWSAAVP